MNIQLKKEIFLYMIENHNEFQLVNSTVKKFKQYIYTENGEFCIGGEEVHDFILQVNKL